MKYSIHGFSQPRAVELGLSNDDLLVLRWFVDFCGTGKMQSIVEPDGIYYWVRYESVLEDLPVLRISKDRLYRKHFRTLCAAQVLRHKHIKGGGSFSYYGYSINYESLVYLRGDTPTVNIPEGAAEIPEGTVKLPYPYGKNTATPAAKILQPYGENTATKINLLDQSITNHSIKDSDNPSLPHTEESAAQVINLQEKRFGEFWAAYPKKVGKAAAKKSWIKIKPTTELQSIILKAIEAQKRSVQWQRENGRFIPNPTTWLNQGRWEDELTKADERVQSENNRQHCGKDNGSFTLSGFKMATGDDYEWGTEK